MTHFRPALSHIQSIRSVFFDSRQHLGDPATMLLARKVADEFLSMEIGTKNPLLLII